MEGWNEGWKDASFWKTSFGRVWTGSCIWWLRAFTRIFDVMIQETHPQVVASNFVHLDKMVVGYRVIWEEQCTEQSLPLVQV